MMPKHIAVTLDQVMQAVEADEYLGFCVTCGTEHMNVEPDAREYPCEECGENAVYGAQELIFTMVA